jgi:hypothetical protein
VLGYVRRPGVLALVQTFADDPSLPMTGDWVTTITDSACASCVGRHGVASDGHHLMHVPIRAPYEARPQTSKKLVDHVPGVLAAPSLIVLAQAKVKVRVEVKGQGQGCAVANASAAAGKQPCMPAR